MSNILHTIKFALVVITDTGVGLHSMRIQFIYPETVKNQIRISLLIVKPSTGDATVPSGKNLTD